MEAASRLPVTVIVVSFNTREKLRKCLEALDPGLKVVVVDNASADESAEMVRLDFPLVRLIALGRNIGFGPANNLGLDEVRDGLALFLNSDAYVSPEAIKIVAGKFENPSVVAAGPKLLNPDGSLQESCAGRLTLWALLCEQLWLEKLFPNSKLLSPYWQSKRLSITSEVEQVMGACLMIRPIERFDERFFLYCEDTELCVRLRKHGRILYVPEATVTHELGSSSAGSDRWKSVARYNRGKELYFRIHYGSGTAMVAFVIDRLGAFLRLLVWSLATVVSLGRTRDKVKLFWKVLFAPVSGPSAP